MKAHVTFEVDVIDLPGFMAHLGLTSAPTIEGVTDATPRRSRITLEAPADAATTQASEAVPSAPRRRRGSTEAPVTEAAPAVQPAASDVASGSRRRRTATVDATVAPVGISDIDLTKGASEAAEALTKLGDNGTQIIQDVLKEDFGVDSVGAIPADQRQVFLDAIQEQVDLAKADAAKA